MPSDGNLVNVSNIVHYFACSSLENLSTYHKHQARLLSEIFLKIERKRLLELVSDPLFVHDIPVIKRYIYRLERTLRGGSIAVWFQFQESQEELARIQRLLAPHECAVLDKDKFNKRIQDARTRDDAAMREKIEDLVEKFQSNKRRMFQRPTESYLDNLFPKVENPTGSEGHRMLAFKSILSKFTTIALYPLSRLMTTLNSYLDARLHSLQQSYTPLELQVIRKPSGSIVTVLIGSNSRSDIQTAYCPEVAQMGKLPILYTTRAHRHSQREFVVAQQAILARPDSRKYVVWRHGVAPSTDIYLVEKMGEDPFILATLLGADIRSDVVIPLPRDGMAVKNAICQSSEDPWITEDGWVAYNMHDLRCNSSRLLDYNHQIFIPGPP
ncbi:hypothetical protein B0H19DRAFT_1380552 [Mycena capillaripes]|nr:hypothetical protein B0H19DRAFT_1380552 [Mycena capillaripes]